MNKMKAILHNKVLSNFSNKDKYPYDYIVVDQFENPKSYYSDEEDDEDVPTLTGESVQTRTMKGCLKNKKQLNQRCLYA